MSDESLLKQQAKDKAVERLEEFNVSKGDIKSYEEHPVSLALKEAFQIQLEQVRDELEKGTHLTKEELLVLQAEAAMARLYLGFPEFLKDMLELQQHKREQGD
jgi:uncharacterized coiled-coil DUF342 family protein